MADSFTALSFAGAVGKLAINVSNASLGRILDCYGEAGGKNVALGTSAQDNEDTDAFVKKHHYEDTNEVTTFRSEHVTWCRSSGLCPCWPMKFDVHGCTVRM